MSVTTLSSCSLLGTEAPQVKVEVHIASGLPNFSIVGMPDTSVRESRNRVKSAIINSGFRFPRGQITVNLSPADVPKQSSRFDLAIALGILIASQQIFISETKRQDLNDILFLGELSLSGEINPIHATLIMALAYQKRCPNGLVILPTANLNEVSVVDNLRIIGIKTLREISQQLANESWSFNQAITHIQPEQHTDELCFSDVKGQMQAIRALEICASGGHGILLSGPPGVGKTMLASRMPSILPPLSKAQHLEVLAIHSLNSHHSPPYNTMQPPFRAPHHSASAVALVGGGACIKPGEISLAHHGVLFLDELPEFNRHVLESLREPLETGRVNISRAKMQISFPAKFQLLATMNPCPCGYLGSKVKSCRCRPDQIQRYRHKLSGPLLDRIDILLSLPDSQYDESQPRSEPSSVIRERVTLCREIQMKRQSMLNALLPAKHPALTLATTTQHYFNQIATHFQWSMRASQRIIRVARTIADMQGKKTIDVQDLSEATGYRVEL